MVKWKINYTLTVKSPTSAIKPMQPSFYLQMISRTHRQRERERERESTSHSPKPRSGLTSAKLRPAQIVLPHSPDHVALPPRSHAGQASSFFSLLPQRRRHLDRSLASRSRRHHLRPISFLTHPRPISSPPLKMVAVAKDQSLFPDLSLFPSISQSFSL